jgi:hypothetical protein
MAGPGFISFVVVLEGMPQPPARTRPSAPTEGWRWLGGEEGGEEEEEWEWEAAGGDGGAAAAGGGEALDAAVSLLLVAGFACVLVELVQGVAQLARGAACRCGGATAAADDDDALNAPLLSWDDDGEEVEGGGGQHKAAAPLVLHVNALHALSSSAAKA